MTERPDAPFVIPAGPLPEPEAAHPSEAPPLDDDMPEGAAMVRATRLAARGWTREGGELFETLDRLNAAGCARYVVTDVASDGMLSGPNLQLLRDVCARTDAPVVASDGISTLDDLRALRELVPLGVEGAIVGTALYVGNFTIADALDACAG